MNKTNTLIQDIGAMTHKLDTGRRCALSRETLRDVARSGAWPPVKRQAISLISLFSGFYVNQFKLLELYII